MKISCVHVYRCPQLFVAEPKEVLFTDYQVGEAYQVRQCNQIMFGMYAKIVTMSVVIQIHVHVHTM